MLAEHGRLLSEVENISHTDAIISIALINAHNKKKEEEIKQSRRGRRIRP